MHIESSWCIAIDHWIIIHFFTCCVWSSMLFFYYIKLDLIFDTRAYAFTHRRKSLHNNTVKFDHWEMCTACSMCNAYVYNTYVYAYCICWCIKCVNTEPANERLKWSNHVWTDKRAFGCLCHVSQIVNTNYIISGKIFCWNLSTYNCESVKMRAA